VPLYHARIVASELADSRLADEVRTRTADDARRRPSRNVRLISLGLGSGRAVHHRSGDLPTRAGCYGARRTLVPTYALLSFLPHQDMDRIVVSAAAADDEWLHGRGDTNVIECVRNIFPAK
jgi:hypothetical protein